ncbi:DNA-binding transcriptional regulator, LysR family [Collimonas sp. OK607]|uniref:LysR family transcriptional regulator n=1 Tax=Collimonas sp. OK607 TaxID=1798194 RepID=UPI0008EF142E|nr:LysR family transcriptional regulator [Collimonas sp. OK607]SFB38334.1 DNA-binding transcriptional regulator, LysR family [Collimonas sp. OK607]
MDLKDIDLNLLIVFNQLLLEKRVSAVGETLGLSQPAVSNALNRLRRLLGDELFLRTSRGMEPTPFATQLAEPIAYALSTILNTLNQRATFEPAVSTRKFTIGMTDIGEIYFLPKLMDIVARIAPGVSISTVRNTATNLRDEMEAGHVDLAIGLLPQLKAGYFQQRLFKQHYVCMFRQGHALDKKKVSVEEFERADHVVVISPGTGHDKVDESIARKGIRRNVRLTVPHFVAVGHILSTTDMVATVPERYARECLAPFGLKYVHHPVALPEIGINVFWHAKYHKEPGNQWLRSVIFDTFSDRL